MQHSLRAIITTICLSVCLFSVQARADEGEDDTLALFSAWQEQSSASSRSPKPLSQTAENVTVVTSADIAAMNAHTLADILDTIPGIQVAHNGGPGITAYTFIQSSRFTHVQVYVDGVSITNMADNYSETTLIPARIIERVEIVKGSASAAWGSALAGVINVITKAPAQDKLLSGTASASIGTRSTADTSVELSGSSGRLGYYFSGGYLGSNGLLPNTQLNSTNSHARLTWALPDSSQLYATFTRIQLRQGDLFAPAYDLKEDQDKVQLVASVGLKKTLTERLTLETLARHTQLTGLTSWFNISDGGAWSGQELPQGSFRQRAYGADLKLIWRGDSHLLVGGGEYNHLETGGNSSDASTYSPYNRSTDRWGTFLNDTITLGDFSITPGARFDHNQTSGHQYSYSLGGTWQAHETTMLRLYAARGFGSTPLLSIDTPTEKIWTTQIGMESTVVPHLWLKGTIFRNETWGLDDGRHIALGAEAEARTIPVWNTSIGAGYTFVDTTRSSDGSQINYLPRHTVKLSLRYDDKTCRALLTGSHINWNSMTGDNPRYGGLLWDLHLGATLLKRENASLELFFSGRNLLNNGQYQMDLVPSPGRWFEGGMRVSF